MEGRKKETEVYIDIGYFSLLHPFVCSLKTIFFSRFSRAPNVLNYSLFFLCLISVIGKLYLSTKPNFDPLPFALLKLLHYTDNRNPTLRNRVFIVKHLQAYNMQQQPDRIKRSINDKTISLNLSQISQVRSPLGCDKFNHFH